MSKAPLIKRLRNLGQVNPGWEKSSLSYFSHSGGRVSLAQADDFFKLAVALCEEAAAELEKLEKR